MDNATLIAELLKISAAAFATVEFLKPWLKMFFAQLEELTENGKKLLYGSIAFVIAFILVLLGGPELNLFLNNDALAPILGKVATAFITGLGPTVINALGNAFVLRAITIPRMRALAIKAEAFHAAEQVGNTALKEELKAEQI